MADFFQREDILNLFGKGGTDSRGPGMRSGKSILMIGDSIMRCIYKDLIHMLNPENKNSLCKVDSFRTKFDDSFEGKRFSFQGDKLLNVTYGKREGKEYREERDYYDPVSDIQVTYVFITRVYSPYLVKLIDEYPIRFGSYPDLVLMNSALWDINRHGGFGIRDYRKNMYFCMDLFKSTLPRYSQFVWCTTPPISCEIVGGFSLKHLQEFQGDSMRFNIMEGNAYTANTVAVAGFDVLDMHFHCRNIVFRRAADGIHWNPDAVRFQTNLWLTHYCLSNKLEHMLPGKWKDPGNPDHTNAELEEAMRLMRVADHDLHPLTDRDPGIKQNRYKADSYKWMERDESFPKRVESRPVPRTFLRAKRRNPTRK